MKRSRVLFALLAAPILLCLAAAGVIVWDVRFRQPPLFNGELAFETLERERAPDAPTSFFPREAPGLLVLTSLNDIASASSWLNSSAVRRLRELNWDESLAIVAFRGYQTHSVGGFEIERVVRQDGEVGIYANTGPIGEELIPTSPYHVIAVRKVGQWDGALTFRLYLDAAGEVAQSVKEAPESSIPLWPR